MPPVWHSDDAETVAGSHAHRSKGGIFMLNLSFKAMVAISAAVISTALLMAGCTAVEATPTSYPVSVPTATFTSVPTPTQSPEPTATAPARAVLLFPSATHEPTPSPTATTVPTVEGEYSVQVVKVLDGDTFEVEIDEVQVAGLKNQTVRVFGIDTPETRTSDDFEKACGEWSKKRANDFVSSEGQYVLVTEFEDGGFSRILGDIRSPEGVMLSEFMLDERLAIPYAGGTRDFEDHRENCGHLVEAGHISGPETEAIATATEDPTATPEPTSEPKPSQDPTVAPDGDTAQLPTATSTEDPTVTAEIDEPDATYETCEEAEAAGIEREPGKEGPSWGFPIEIVTGERDGDQDGFVCEIEPNEIGKVSPATPTAIPTEPPTIDPEKSSQVYESCDAAIEAGLERIKGDSGDGRGFPASQVPNARDGDGDGVVCER